jgi:hypothetical protein
MQEGYIKERVPQFVWEALLSNYETAVDDKKHQPEPDPAKILQIENERVPLPTVVQRNRNANPMPVSTMFGEFNKNSSEFLVMQEGVGPRIEAWLDRWVRSWQE